MSPSKRYASTLTRVRAVLAHRALYEIGAELQSRAPIGRPAAQPVYVLLIFATLARITRSMVRVETGPAPRRPLIRHELPLGGPLNSVVEVLVLPLPLVGIPRH